MNKIRRKQLQEASELIAKAQGIIESVKDEEQEAHDNLPESIQYGEKGQQMEEYIDMLDEAYGQCDDLMSIIACSSYMRYRRSRHDNERSGKTGNRKD